MLAALGVARSVPTGAIARCWAGALTPTSFKVIAESDGYAPYARLVVSANSDYSNPTYVSSYQAPQLYVASIYSYQTFSFAPTGLTPNTLYYYQVQVKDAPSQQAVTRTIKTAPTAGVVAAFSFAISGCSHLHSNSVHHSCYASYNQHSYNDWFPNERQWITDQIEGCSVPLCLVYGDSHIAILDDGTHGASYATDGFARFPVVASSATFTDTLDPSSSSSTWNGLAKKYSPNFTGIDVNDGGFVTFDVSADNLSGP